MRKWEVDWRAIMPSRSSHRISNARSLRTIAVLVALTFIAHVLVLANPGFFNHDEWSLSDIVEDKGLLAFLSAYVTFEPGPHFGYPVRPIGFAQQGVSAMWMRDYPIVPHAIDVALHSTVVVLLWGLLVRLGFGRRRAIWAAGIFAISPVATVSVAWMGASFDRWYVLFSLVSAYGVARSAREGLTVTGVALVLIGTCGAVLSKETAIVLPGALLIMAYAAWHGDKSRLHVRAALVAIAISVLPIAAYLTARWPAIQATLAGSGGPYRPSIASVPRNLLAYFAQPFFLGDVELASIVPPFGWTVWLALALHALLLAALWRSYGYRAALAYVAGYAVFIFPVLSLPAAAAHYLYASGIPFAVALALLLAPRDDAVPETKWPRGRIALAASVMVFLLGRSVAIQMDMYATGKCQVTFLESFKPLAEDAIATGSRRLHVVGAPGAREYIAMRGLFGRPPYSSGGRWPTVVGAAPSNEGDANFEMQPNCTVLRR